MYAEAASAGSLQRAERSPAFDGEQPKILVRDVKKGFARREGRLEVVGGVSFSVLPGQTAAIVGPSGCGKSTLMNILSGFIEPDAGAVLVDGVLRQGPTPRGILITQQGSVFPWLNVRQNVMFGLREMNEAQRIEVADHYTRLVGLEGFELAFPHELSGGMLKRVELARALAVKPEVLYMDEPFAALDALISLRMRKELLRALERERHTVVLVTHDVEEAIHLADRVLVLSARPTTLKASFELSAPHPRKLGSPELQALKQTILGEIGL